MPSAAARYEKKSAGAVINHSVERGGEDLMKRDKRTRLELTQRPLVQRLERFRALVTVFGQITEADWLVFKSEPTNVNVHKCQTIHFKLVLKFRSKVQRALFPW